MTQPNPNNPREYGLSPEDARVLDALMQARQPEPSQAGEAPDEPAAELTPADLARAQRVRAVMDRIDLWQAPQPPVDLAARTMARIKALDTAEKRLGIANAFGDAPVTRWANVAAVLAIMIIGASLLWPALGQARQDARRIACSTNLQRAGQDMTRYASDNSQALPRTGFVPGSVWWNVGKSTAADQPVESNSAHLYTLVRQAYTDPARLNCPENHDAVDPKSLTIHLNDWPSSKAVSYSYQNQFTANPVRLDRRNSMAVLADKNPLFVPNATGTGLMFNDRASATAASPFHRGKGQNVLLTNGQVLWSNSPVLSNGDNVWLINGVKQYRGTEAPDAPDDAFLVP